MLPNTTFELRWLVDVYCGNRRSPPPVCIQSKLFGNVVYFYCSVEILESVASCTEFVYGKSAPIANVS